ncbi:MAG: hypothetical protein KAI72_10760, partial [Candidatus Pacebacteria bacterium]|nr:hypothetical protein [Candidatus Paceibacterota bacterium]
MMKRFKTKSKKNTVLSKIAEHIRQHPQLLVLSFFVVAGYFDVELPFVLFALGTWSSGGNLATANYTMAGCGSQSAGLGIGGNNSSSTSVEYNGTSWSS